MTRGEGWGKRLDGAVENAIGGSVPAVEGLPRAVAPLPTWLENIGLRLAYPIAALNLLGTAFGFWYYGVHPLPLADPLFVGQFARTPPVMWLFVPDSPVATLFIGLSLIAWKRGWNSEWLHALAFFGCLKLGLWTPYVQLGINGLGETPMWLFHFLVWSHLAMAVEAFVIHRYSDFPRWAIGVALGWYLVNDLVDYFVPIVGDPHHTTLVAEITATGIDHSLPAHDLAAGWAVTLTVFATALAVATGRAKRAR
jgi:uncharacterized membrane protein YpjA